MGLQRLTRIERRMAYSAELDMPPPPVVEKPSPVPAFVPLPLMARDRGTTWETTLRERLEARRQMRARAALLRPPAMARSDVAALLHVLNGLLFLGLRRVGFGLLRTGFWSWRIATHPPFWRAVGARVGHALAYANGWRLWYARKLRTDADTRLATVGLMAGLVVPMLVFLLLRPLFPVGTPDPEPPLDPSVPVPQLALIEALPGAGVISDPPYMAPPTPDVPVAFSLSPQTFRFEQFARLQADGRVLLQGQTVQRQLRAWFPVGSPAAPVLHFFGDTLRRARGLETLTEDEALKLAQQHCLHMPTNKLFTQRTITCTYSHAMPVSASFPPATAFWVLALSYDQAGRLTELGVYAREAFVASVATGRGRR